MRSCKRFVLAVGVSSLTWAITSSTSLAASDFPSHALRLIVPFAPGGGADINARKVAEPWGKVLGQAIVVENKPGAGGIPGAAYVAHAAPDGYTLLWTTPGQQMTAPYLFKDLGYDPYKDLISVGKVTEGANVLVVSNKLPVHSVKELIAYAKANPGKLGFASSGVGSTSHLAGELFKKDADLNIFHVPYRGTGPARTDLIGGQVPMTIDTLSVYLPDIQAGTLRALGVSSLKRSPIAPNIPAIAETLPGFESIPVNYITAPAGTPRAVVDKLNATLNKAMSDPKIQANFTATGTTLEGSSPEGMDKLVHAEQAKWKTVIESANIKIQ